MKTYYRSFLILAVILLVLSTAIYAFMQRDRSTNLTFSATAHRDCAPWDGAAFTVQIPWQNETVIDISIWQSPEFNLPKTFSFPDNSGQIGNVILTTPTGLSQPLGGTVTFSRINASGPVEGQFDLTDETGNVYRGSFSAAWQELMPLCG